MTKKKSLIPSERIIHKILILRDEKVILDVHLAELYGVETRALKQAVKRNIERFPEDFMFELSKEEVIYVVSQNVIPSKQSLGGALPYAFSETGVAMLSSVLRSKLAVEVNISIMRTFVALRKMMLDTTQLQLEIEKIKKKVDNQTKNAEIVFNYLDELSERVDSVEKKQKHDGRERIGFKRPK
jgi:ORF6N domain